MIFTVDIGNTNITVGAFDGEKLSFTARLATDARKTADQYAIDLRNLLALYGRVREDFDGAVISSVVPSVGAAVKDAFITYLGFEPMMLGPGIRSGLNIRIDNPAQTGADLVAGAVGAVSKYPLPCIVLDIGTATTLSVIDGTGAFVGGAIAAGPVASLDALATKTAQLPFIELQAPKRTICTNTVDCMKSGIVIGTAAMLDGMIERIEDELGEKATVVATGGLAERIVSQCRRNIIIDDNLLLDGLRVIYYKNTVK